MSNLIIVAIPDENDRVWKVSSEKVPHLTLLFLSETGQTANLDKIVGFVEHASSMMNRFYLTVDRRGELGEDQADVLFFKKDRYSYKAVRDFRASLLQDNNIRTAYDSVSQFEGPWNPHLTLGYPTNPAKPEDNDWGGFYSVDFNRIAVWTGDFEGPEFPLKDFWDEYETMESIPMDVAMSALTHAETVSEKKWSEFKNSDYTDEQYASACLLDRGQDAGTAKQRYGLPVREPDGTLNRAGCHAAAAVLSSTGGTGSARGNKLNATDEQINKAKNKLVALYRGPLDEDVPEGLGGDSMKQTVELGAAFFEHHGVKGMRWGVRREDFERAAESSTSKVGMKAREIGKFARDVEFEAATQRPKDKQGIEGSSDAEVKIVEKAGDDWRKHDLGPLKARHPNAGFAKRLTRPLSKEAKAYRKDARETYIKRLETTANSITNASGTRQYTVRERGGELPTSQYYWDVTTRQVRHANVDEVTTVLQVIMDEDGYITDLKKVPNSMKQTVERGAEFLEHYGVKGQKWGVRKEETDRGGHIRISNRNNVAAVSTSSQFLSLVGPAAFASPRFRAEYKAAGAHNKQRRIDNKNARKDKKWEKKIYSTDGAVKLHNAMADHFNERIGALNGKPEYKNIDLNAHPDNAIARKYYKDIDALTMEGYREAVKSVHGSSPSGKKQAVLSEDGQSVKIVDVSEKVKHAAEDDEVIEFLLRRDDNGLILEMNKAEQTTTQHTVDLGAMLVSTLLNGGSVEHFGIKGMRWGVRRQGAVTTQSHIDTGLVRRRTQVVAKGGESHPAHDDAVKAAVTKQKLKKSGTDALSNQELRELANRVQLENQVTLLTSSKGKRFVQKQLEEEGKQQFRKGTARAAPHVVRKVKRGAAVGAAAAALA